MVGGKSETAAKRKGQNLLATEEKDSKRPGYERTSCTP